MSLVSSCYPGSRQSYHHHPAPNDFYAYPQAPRYQDHHAMAVAAAMANGDNGHPAYFPNWMFASAQSPGPGAMHPLDLATDGGMNGSPDPAGYGMMPMFVDGVDSAGNPCVRIVKRRGTANKKERRRTHSINSAFSNLRGCIPNVPSDTKLSKIKTLRLATSYIAYLMDVLSRDDTTLTECGFKAELAKSTESREERRQRENVEMLKKAAQTSQRQSQTPDITSCGQCSPPKKNKGRTGWPEHVWASELKQERN